eukprot:12412199-Karenia_brevis.AAC.1
MDSYRLQSCMDRHERTSMRRSHSHATNRNKKDPISTPSTSTPVPTMLPSLEPEGQIPKTAIDGKLVEQGHIAMVSKWNGKGTHQEPTIIKKHWVEVAKERW